MKKRLDLRHLRALVALVEEGGYVRAARAVGVSQSTLSETIRSLERFAGGALVRRAKRSLSLTPIGEALLPIARRMLALESEALARLTDASREVSAQIAIGCSESISAHLLPPALSAVRRRWPKYRIEVHSATCTEVRAGLKSGRYDLGLVCEPASRGDHDASEILEATELILFCAKGNPLAGRNVDPSQLRLRNFHLSDAAGSFAGVLSQYFKAAGLGTAAVMATGSVEGVRRAVVEDSEALGLLPLFAVEDELQQGKLVRIHPMPPLPSVVLKALFKPNRHPSPVIREFLQTLRKVHAHPDPDQSAHLLHAKGGRP